MNTSLFATRVQSRSVSSLLPRSLLVLGLPIAVGSATALAALEGPAWLPLAFVASMVAFQLAIMLGDNSQLSTGEVRSDILETPFLLSHDRRAFELYRRLAGALLNVSQRTDIVHRDLALDRIAKLATEAEELGIGRITFDNTETWRLTYERLLRSPGTSCYRSISVIHTAQYWHEEPGRQSMRLNHELARTSRLSIKRIAIIDDALWNPTTRLPCAPLTKWLQEQAANRIDIRAVKLSMVRSEPDLIVDCGIYGSRAVGQQETDANGNTARFALDFCFDKVLEAEERWERLAVYATKVDELSNC